MYICPLVRCDSYDGGCLHLGSLSKWPLYTPRQEPQNPCAIPSNLPFGLLKLKTRILNPRLDLKPQPCPPSSGWRQRNLIKKPHYAYIVQDGFLIVIGLKKPLNRNPAFATGSPPQLPSTSTWLLPNGPQVLSKFLKRIAVRLQNKAFQGLGLRV